MKIDGTKGISDSPCIGRCSTHLGDNVCRGCHRTNEEVINWVKYENEEKILINRRLRTNKGE